VIVRAAIIFLGPTCLLCSTAHAEKRVALNIGNGAYVKVTALGSGKSLAVPRIVRPDSDSPANG
jgi:hypothetical protein